MEENLESISDLSELKEKYGDKLPRHVGLILDGNRRWIHRLGIKDTMKGHKAGYEALKNILKPMFDLGIKYLSIYALSSENIAKRSPREIKYLFKLLNKALHDVLNEPRIKDYEPQIKIIGRIQDLPQDIQDGIKTVNEATSQYSNCFINVCINYDGQLELVDAIKEIVKKGIDPNDIDKDTIKKNIYCCDFPEADYIIRTGMEDGARISGFLLWDSSYAEFRFRKELWPEYNEALLIEDMKEYIRRNRRKGS